MLTTLTATDRITAREVIAAEYADAPTEVRQYAEGFADRIDREAGSTFFDDYLNVELRIEG